MHTKSSSLNKVEVESVNFQVDSTLSIKGEDISKKYKKNGFSRPFSIAQVASWIYTAYQVLSYLFLSLQPLEIRSDGLIFLSVCYYLSVICTVLLCIRVTRCDLMDTFIL